MGADPTLQPITADDGWYVGEDQIVQWTIANSSGGVQDITGFTLQFKMALTKAGSSVLTKTVPTTTPASGICAVTMAAADTNALTPTSYFYTLRRTDAGQNGVVAHGPAVLLGAPT